MKYIELAEVPSTNTYVKENAASLPDVAVIFTNRQTAGRGQKGNSWEAQPGKNLTFSILVKRPEVDVKRQFRISEAVSLAIVEYLDRYAQGFAIKWPNDIYHDDKKIAGILIENSLQDTAIDYTVIGIGLNINQRRFESDAPNPVSLVNITGDEYPLITVLHEICERIVGYLEHTGDSDLHARYMSRLWRNDGKFYPFMLPDGRRFSAAISDVDPDGMLTLLHRADNSLHRYAFKQVLQLINND